MSLLTQKLQTQLEFIDYLIDSIETKNYFTAHGQTIFAALSKPGNPAVCNGSRSNDVLIHSKLMDLLETETDSHISCIGKTFLANFYRDEYLTNRPDLVTKFTVKAKEIRLEIIETLQHAMALEKINKAEYPSIYAKETSDSKTFTYDQLLEYLEDAGLSESEISRIKYSCVMVDKLTTALK